MNIPFLTNQEIEDLKKQESLSDKEQKRTPQQIEAIYSSGQNILVSASAGSGKTFVMVERIMDKLNRGVQLDQLFISTFTVKAAAEFKERLDKKLLAEMKKLSCQEPVDQELLEHLSRQRVKLATADIGTMDSFTQKFVGEFGYKKGVGIGFRILQDRNEQSLLKNKIFTALVEDYFTKFSSRFSALLSQYTNKKSLEDFREIVYKIYNFIQSTSDPIFWLEHHFLTGYKKFTDLSSLPDSDFIEVKTALYEMANFYQSMLESGVWNNKNGALSAKDKKGQQVLDSIPSLVSSIEMKDPLAFCEQVEALLDGKLLSKTGETGLYSKFTRLADFYEKYRHMDLVVTYQSDMIPHLELLRDFVKDFYQTYLEYKISESVLEFSDISHLAIDILRENEDIRRFYQEKYHEVMVDEYQDTNSIQEEILELISKANNRFMVGDIKQSIYGFRQADPLIFREKLDQYSSDSGKGKLILLLENFRSQIEVLSATNSVFEYLMDRDVGEIAYDATQSLQAGSDKQTKENADYQAECLIYTSDTVEETEEAEFTDVSEYEMVAKEIIYLHQEKGVAFEDIALLVRNKTHNDAIISTFDRYHIPIAPDERQPNYLKSIEIMVMLNTLRSLDNPLNDVALVSLMHSPMFVFTEDELMRIRLQDLSTKEEKESSLYFYDKLLLAYKSKGNHPDLITKELADKIEDFVSTLDNWRNYATTHSLYNLIWKIYNERYYYDYVGGLPNGEQRQVNLYALATRANQYEMTGFKGLSRFVNMIDNLVKSGNNDLDDVPVRLPSQAVKLMTIHKSKGLEFQYVFLLNLSSKFNSRDMTAKIILDKDNGIGSKQVVDMKEDFPDSPFPFINVSMDNLPYTINKEKLLISQRSEEMRLLYVGMTRAERKLYLVASSNLEKFKGENREGAILSKQYRIHGAKSFFDWIYSLKNDLLPVMKFREFSQEDLQGIQPLSFTAYSQTNHQLRQDEEILEAKAILDSVDDINTRYAAGIHLPTLQTPSQIKKLYESLMEQEGLLVMGKKKNNFSFELPNLTGKPTVSPTEVGSTVHKLMQRLDFSKEITMPYLEESLSKTQASPEIRKQIDLQKVYNFFTTELGQLLLATSDKLIKEMPFSMLKTDELSQEQYVIRGIIDGFLLLNDRIILFDYKTDKFTSLDKISMIKDRYKGQMSLYAEALKLAYEVDKVDKYLVLLGGPEIVIEKL